MLVLGITDKVDITNLKHYLLPTENNYLHYLLFFYFTNFHQ